jgi:hypothetical protein
MNFTDLLNWISGRTSENTVAKAESARERRRFYRIDFADGKMAIPGVGECEIVNASYGGVRVKIGTIPVEKFRNGECLQASITLGRAKFTTNVKICNCFNGELGCSFEELTSAHARILSDFLKPRILGTSLQEINASALQNHDPTMTLRWFQGEDGAQIFLWQTLDGGLIKEEFYFCNYLISFDQKQKTMQIGAVKDDSVGKTGFGRIDQNSIVFFRIPSHRALKMGRIILESSTLPAEAKDQLLASILREERRLYNRYVVGEGDGIVKFKQENGAELTVVNLSLRGIAFLLPESAGCGQELLKNGTMTGGLEIHGQIFPATVRLVYCHEHVLGGSLALLHEHENELLAAYLGPRLLGQSLEEVPPPGEMRPHTPQGSKASLFLGVHNTHVLLLVSPKQSLLYARMAFMDFVAVYDRGALGVYRCPADIILPTDWELPLESLENADSEREFVLATGRKMLENSCLPSTMQAFWQEILSPQTP